jgi:LuxR family transcriptional regulator of csgAB operon
MPENKKSAAPANEKAVCYVIGPMKLQNELMAAYLNQKTGNPCQAIDDIGQVLKDRSRGESRQNLLFLDCRGKSLNVLLTELDPFINNNRSSNFIVLFNVPADMAFQKKLISRGIHGFFYECDPLDKFVKGVQAVLDGQLWLSREMMTRCILEGTGSDASSKTNGDLLTERQIEIIAMVAVGSTNEEISDKLCISPHTVKTHLYKIFKKINVPNRVQAALWAAKNL